MSTSNFKDFIKEDISTGSLDKATFLIAKYLKRKTGYSFFQLPGIEKFSGGSSGGGSGIRLFSGKGNISIRFNWKSSGPTASSLSSIDIWLNNKQPFYLEFEKTTGLVKTIPLVANIINAGGPTNKTVYTLPDGVSLNEHMEPSFRFVHLNEAKAAIGDVGGMFDDIVEMMTDSGFSKGMVYKTYKSAGVKVFDAIVGLHPKLMQKKGTAFKFVGKPADLAKVKNSKDDILLTIGCTKGTVKRGSAGEKYADNSNADALMADRDRISFEKQLEDLENLLKLTVNGAANAIFIAGRGGVGKTHTTEKVLADMGLRDGSGYFKNTGSTTAAGMYSLLFRYKNDIILFDDSDDAFKDQESRNLLKAATDTKKIRKLVWNKMGKNVVDPEEDITDEEMLDQNLIPRYFEFTGKIIFITNLKMQKLDPDGALRTRAYIIDIDPTEAEIYDFMDQIVDKIKLEDGLTLDLTKRKKVVDLLRKGKSKQEPNLRKLSRGLNMAAGALSAGVAVKDGDLRRMIETYA
tara:strand:+ start:6437 stop:7990 length:1554 start_codon:yes stop_codon:yes gene_type:complete